MDSSLGSRSRSLELVVGSISIYLRKTILAALDVTGFLHSQGHHRCWRATVIAPVFPLRADLNDRTKLGCLVPDAVEKGF